MKVLTGIHAANIFDFPYPKKLIDTALQGTSDLEACGNFNIVYVLYGAQKLEPNYRKSEIESFLLNRIKLYKQFYHPEFGGFSFYPNETNQYYYGKQISVGKNEPDIHGTIMFIWGISIVNKMLNLGLDFTIPTN